MTDSKPLASAFEGAKTAADVDVSAPVAKKSMLRSLSSSLKRSLTPRGMSPKTPNSATSDVTMAPSPFAPNASDDLDKERVIVKEQVKKLEESNKQVAEQTAADAKETIKHAKEVLATMDAPTVVSVMASEPKVADIPPALPRQVADTQPAAVNTQVKPAAADTVKPADTSKPAPPPDKAAGVALKVAPGSDKPVKVEIAAVEPAPRVQPQPPTAAPMQPMTPTQHVTSMQTPTQHVTSVQTPTQHVTSVQTPTQQVTSVQTPSQHVTPVPTAAPAKAAEAPSQAVLVEPVYIKKSHEVTNSERTKSAKTNSEKQSGGNPLGKLMLFALTAAAAGAAYVVFGDKDDKVKLPEWADDLKKRARSATKQSPKVKLPKVALAPAKKHWF